VLPVPTNTIDDVLFALQELLDEHTLVHDTEAVDRAVDLVEASLHLLLTVTEEDVVASSRLVGLHDDLVRVRVPVPQENLGGVPVTSYGLLNSPDPGLPNGLPHDVLVPPRRGKEKRVRPSLQLISKLVGEENTSLSPRKDGDDGMRDLLELDDCVLEGRHRVRICVVVLDLLSLKASSLLHETCNGAVSLAEEHNELVT